MPPPAPPDVTPCGPASSLRSASLREALAGNRVAALEVHEIEGGARYFVVVIMRRPRGARHYLVTKRDDRRPRLFVDLRRLTDSLRGIAPSLGVSIVRDASLPPAVP